jgi:hypothetical protein
MSEWSIKKKVALATARILSCGFTLLNKVATRARLASGNGELLYK